MAIIDAADYAAQTNQTFTVSQKGAIGRICSSVDAAIKKLIYPFSPEPVTVTDAILDAPIRNTLLLPVLPVRSVTSIYLRWFANGDPTAFTSDTLLTQYSDYYLPIDHPVEGYSRTGMVYTRNGSVWGYEWRRPAGRLGTTLDPNRGAIKATFAAGLTTVPADIVEAAVLAVSLLYYRGARGMPVTSESWNGESISYAGPFTATAAVLSPDVPALLAPYLDPLRVGTP